MKVVIGKIHARTGQFSLSLTAETPEDARVLNSLHKEHITSEFGSGEFPQATIVARVTPETAPR